MNQLNYASLEASKRLVEAGIVLETEFFYIERTGKFIYCYDIIAGVGEQLIPAPSMAEVWRELPRYVEIKKHFYELMLNMEPDSFTCAHYSNLQTNHSIFRTDNPNPTDALIDLLIWVRKEKP